MDECIPVKILMPEEVTGGMNDIPVTGSTARTIAHSIKPSHHRRACPWQDNSRQPDFSIFRRGCFL